MIEDLEFLFPWFQVISSELCCLFTLFVIPIPRQVPLDPAEAGPKKYEVLSNFLVKLLSQNDMLIRFECNTHANFLPQNDLIAMWTHWGFTHWERVDLKQNSTVLSSSNNLNLRDSCYLYVFVDYLAVWCTYMCLSPRTSRWINVCA